MRQTWIKKLRQFYLVVIPFLDHAFSVLFQNTHAGMEAGHTAVVVSDLPSQSTSTTSLAGPGQLTSLVLRLPRGQVMALLIVAACTVEISSGGVRADSTMATLASGNTMSIWLMVAITATGLVAPGSATLPPHPNRPRVSAHGRLFHERSW